MTNGVFKLHTEIGMPGREKGLREIGSWFFLNMYSFIWLHWVLVVARGFFQLWHAGSSSLTRD